MLLKDTVEWLRPRICCEVTEIVKVASHLEEHLGNVDIKQLSFDFHRWWMTSVDEGDTGDDTSCTWT